MESPTFVPENPSVNIMSSHASSEITDEPMELQNDSNQFSIPKFYETIPTLKEMSSLVAAISLWRKVITLQCKSSSPSFFKIDDEEVEKLLFLLPVSRSTRESIKNSISGVRKEMENWLRFYKRKIFNSKQASGEGTINMGDLLFCCWQPDGKIDHRASAVNMLSNPRLTLVDRFKIMSKYCLEDEIKKISAESLPSYFTKSIYLTKYTLSHYWLSYIKNDLDRMPTINGESIVPYMITTPCVDNWSAIEYLWDRLNADEQTSKLEKILDRRPEFQKKLFFKMNESQKIYLVSEIPVKIMGNFWNQPGHEQFVFTTWMYSRNFIDYQQFKHMMVMLTSGTLSNIDEKIRCLVEIWNHCPDHLIHFAFQPAFVDIVVDFHTHHSVKHGSFNFKFLTAYLSSASVELRKQIIFQRANALELWLDLSAADQLIKLCLPKVGDIVKFKKKISDSKFIQHHLHDLLNKNNFDRINKILDFYCPDSNDRSKLVCKKLLLGFVIKDCSLHHLRGRFPIRSCPYHKPDIWINVMEFIDQNLLPTLPNLALQFKKCFVFSFADFCCELWSNDDKMAKMINIVVTVLSGKELKGFKSQALSRVQANYRWSKFNENLINGFLLWCCNYKDYRVRKFKKSLSIDVIFECVWFAIKGNNILGYDVGQEVVCKILEPLDRCLLWYFQNVYEVKSFKLRKVFGYCDEGAKMFSRYDNVEVFTRNMLLWFFQGDRKFIEMFRERYKDVEIGRMI